MSRVKGGKDNKPDLRQKLTADFVAALQADWDLHGQEIIAALRTKAPTKYAEIISRFAMPDPLPAADDFSQCKTMQDIGRGLLKQIGLSEDAITDSMIEQAVAANDVLVAELERIAEGN
jgi:hypothetical protein